MYSLSVLFFIYRQLDIIEAHQSTNPKAYGTYCMPLYTNLIGAGA